MVKNHTAISNCSGEIHVCIFIHLHTFVAWPDSETDKIFIDTINLHRLKSDMQCILKIIDKKSWP